MDRKEREEERKKVGGRDRARARVARQKWSGRLSCEKTGYEPIFPPNNNKKTHQTHVSALKVQVFQSTGKLNSKSTTINLYFTYE
jgi:hypothetical protein